MFSIYESKNATKPTKTINLEEAYNIISTGTYLKDNDIKDQNYKIRSETDKIKRGVLKDVLPVFVFSGDFKSERRNESEFNYSNYLCIDIDNLETDKVTSLFNEFKAWNNIVHLMFISPSGQGIKIIFQVDNTTVSEHSKVYLALLYRIRDRFNLVIKDKSNPEGNIDQSCKDVARCCYMSYDNTAYFDESAYCIDGKQLIKDYATEFKEVTRTPKNSLKQNVNSTANINSDIDIIEHICNEVEAKNISLSNCHNDNITIAWALLSVTDNPDYFHRITKLNPDYDYKRMQDRWNMLSKRDNKFSIGTLIFYALQAGISLPDTIDLTDLEYVSNWLTNQYQYRFNEISSKVEYREIESSDKVNTNTWNQLEDFILNGWYIKLRKLKINYNETGKQKSKKLNINKSDLWDLINNYDFSKRVNPIVEYFKELQESNCIDSNNPLTEVNKWVGGFNYKNKEYARGFWLDWFYGVVQNLTSTDYYDKIMVLSGPGGAGKTYAITKRLCEPFKDYLTTNFNWNAGNKDELAKITKYLFILDDELNTSRKADVEMIKNITSMQFTDIREAYARNDVRRNRIANFIATTNNREFLTDLTGNRRFLVLEVETANRDLINTIDYKKLWAEIWNYYFVLKNKSDLGNEVINQNNENFRSISPEEEALDKCFDFSNIQNEKTIEADFYPTTIKEILDQIKAVTGSDFKEDARTTNKIKAILNSKGLNNSNVRRNGKQGKYWFLKLKDESSFKNDFNIKNPKSLEFFN